MARGKQAAAAANRRAHAELEAELKRTKDALASAVIERDRAVAAEREAASRAEAAAYAKFAKERDSIVQVWKDNTELKRLTAQQNQVGRVIHGAMCDHFVEAHGLSRAEAIAKVNALGDVAGASGSLKRRLDLDKQEKYIQALPAQWLAHAQREN